MTTLEAGSALKSVIEIRRSQRNLQEKIHSTKIKRLHYNYAKLAIKPRNQLLTHKLLNLNKNYKHLRSKLPSKDAFESKRGNYVERNKIEIPLSITAQLKDSLPKLKILQEQSREQNRRKNKGVNNSSVTKKLNTIIKRNKEKYINTQRNAIYDTFKLRKTEDFKDNSQNSIKPYKKEIIYW